MNKKIIYVRIARLFIILSFGTLTMFAVSLHSSYLSDKYIRIALFSLSVIFVSAFVLYIGKYYESDYVKFKPITYICNILTVLLCGLIIAFNLLVYGNQKFKDWFVTTANASMHHRYYANLLYSEAEINDVMNRNQIIEPDEVMDPSLVVKEEEFTYDESNEYEKALFEGHTKDEEYRLIRFTVNGQGAYLAVLYDPSRIYVETTRYINRYGEYVLDMAKRTNALIATNAGRFVDKNHTSAGGVPAGVTISNGEIISNLKYNAKFGVIGFNQDDVLVLYKGIDANEAVSLGIRDAVSSKPFLIVNGEASFTKGNGGYGFAARTAIGQREDGVVLLLVVDSNETRTNGASMNDLTNTMLNYGAINAAALDGGTSTSMIERGVMISKPVNSKLKHVTRPVPTAIIYK